MGLFDSPDERLLKKLHFRAQGAARAVRALAHEIGVTLSYPHTREVEHVLFAAWLQHQVVTHGVRVLGNSTLLQYAVVINQASRIGARFTREQAGVYDKAVRATKAEPSTYGIDLGEDPRAPIL